MFSLPISWPSHGALGRVFSLDSWLSHLRLWHNSEHSSLPTGVPARNFKSPIDATFSQSLPSVTERLILNLPSPSMHWDFEDSECNYESDSESSSANSSRCSTPTVEHDLPLDTTPDAFPNLPITANRPNHPPAKQPAHDGSDTQTLLAQYSEQELVLLEFLTHSSSSEGLSIADVLHLYPPGFANECRCDPQDDEGEDLCQVCRLTEAYLDYSFERYQGLAAVLV